MNKRTLKALRGSIRKWEHIATGHETDKGSTNCPLCQEFMYRNRTCHGCPVSERTSKASCSDTPYDKFQVITYSENRELTGIDDVPSDCVAGPLAQQAAIDEYEFLVSLLPPGAKP